MQRLEEFLMRDKFSNLQQVSEILQSEVTQLSRNFFLFSKDPVVRFRKEKDKFVFNIEIEAERIKPFGGKFLN